MKKATTIEEAVRIVQEWKDTKKVIKLPADCAEGQGRVADIIMFKFSHTDSIEKVRIAPVKNDIYKENKRKFHDD